MLHGYSEIIRGNLSKVQRLKIVALVTVEVHARDVIDKLAKAGCKDINAFDWLSQLRLYWEKVKYENTYRQFTTGTFTSSYHECGYTSVQFSRINHQTDIKSLFLCYYYLHKHYYLYRL